MQASFPASDSDERSAGIILWLGLERLEAGASCAVVHWPSIRASILGRVLKALAYGSERLFITYNSSHKPCVLTFRSAMPNRAASDPSGQQKSQQQQDDGHDFRYRSD